MLYLHADIPDQPQNLSVTFDDFSESLNITITWAPPENSGKFDLEEYTVSIASSSGLDLSERVPSGTTTLILTDEKQQRIMLNASVTAMDKCGQTGSSASETWEYIYIPSKIIYIYIYTYIYQGCRKNF